jgi:hypothetical protein
MRRTQNAKNGRAAAWGEILGAVQESIDDTLAKAAAREAALAAPAEEIGPSLKERLDAMAQGWHTLTSSPSNKAQAASHEADLDFSSVEEALRLHMTAIENLRQALAGWMGRAVG